MLAGARPAFVGIGSFAETPDPFDWRPIEATYPEPLRAFRASAEAAHLGLLAPRVLLRQPYGQETDPVAAFPFEELGEERSHDALLWGCPTLMAGHLLGEAAAEDDAPTVAGGRVGGLPVPTRRTEAGTEVTPCA